jgi:hypothetical protein
VPARKPYQRFTYDGDLELSTEDAMLQAAQALDTAADMAVRTDDKDTLLAVAAGWMNFSQVLMALGAEPVTETQEEPDIELGFRVPTTGSISIDTDEQ